MIEKVYRPSELYNKIKSDKDCLFVAYIANNLNYVGVNAFIDKLHEENGIELVSGIVVNLRNNPEYGHSFADDSFRFPPYANIEVIHLSESDVVNRESVFAKLVFFLMKRLFISKRKSKLYFLSDSINISAHVSLVYMTDRRVDHFIIAQAADYTYKGKLNGVYICETISAIIERVLAGGVVFFRPFHAFSGMERCKDVERFYREGTENEHLVLSEIDYSKKYIIYISQGNYLKDYSDIVEEVLDKEIKKGYDIYIKPHSHERVASFPQKNDYNILPKSYAIESMVGSAPQKPSKIIGFDSTSLCTCSAWFEIPCYSIVDIMPEWSEDETIKGFISLIESGEYPNLFFSKGMEDE